MNSNIFFNKTTEKLYNIVQSEKEKKKLKGYPHPKSFDIKVNKNKFKEKEWQFLVENEPRFYYYVEKPYKVNNKYPVYKIDRDILSTNEIVVCCVSTKFH